MGTGSQMRPSPATSSALRRSRGTRRKSACRRRDTAASRAPRPPKRAGFTGAGAGARAEAMRDGSDGQVGEGIADGIRQGL
jgi:hypothetical protein